jgi:hypothetical protein
MVGEISLVCGYNISEYRPTTKNQTYSFSDDAISYGGRSSIGR